MESRVTITNYAKFREKTRKTIYAWIKDGLIKSEIVGGVEFVVLNEKSEKELYNLYNK